MTKQSSYRPHRPMYSPVQCCVLAKMHQHPEAIDLWKEKIEWFTATSQFRELDRIDGEPIEFEWQYFPRIHNFADSRWNSENDGRNAMWTWTSSYQCTMTLYGETKKTKNCVLRAPWWWQNKQKGSRMGIGYSSDLLSEKKWCGSNTCKPNWEWDDVAEQMMLNFKWKRTSLIPWNKCFGTLRSKGCGKLSVHVSGDPETVEVVFRTIISVNQLSIYGAVPDICEEVASKISDCPASTGKPVAEEKPETMVSPTDLSTAANPLLTRDRARRNLLQEYKQKLENRPDELRIMQVSSDTGSMKTVVPGQYFMTKDEAELAKIDRPVSRGEYTLPRDDDSFRPKGWIRGNTKMGRVLEVTTSYHQGRHGVEIRVDSLSGDGSHSWVVICSGLTNFVTECHKKCERVVLGKSAKVLISWSVQGICPPHRGRWSWWPRGRTRW